MSDWAMMVFEGMLVFLTAPACAGLKEANDAFDRGDSQSRPNADSRHAVNSLTLTATWIDEQEIAPRLGRPGMTHGHARTGAPTRDSVRAALAWYSTKSYTF